MNDELEILQCLIENRIFAPSPSALAKRLAYKGKMTIYRVMEGKVSFRVVHDVWRKLLKEFHITDDIPYFIGRVCYITKLFHNAILPEMNTKHPEWIENVLISLIDDIYVYNSDKFNKEFVPILKDLRRVAVVAKSALRGTPEAESLPKIFGAEPWCASTKSMRVEA